MKEYTKAIESILSFYAKLKQVNPKNKAAIQAAEDCAIFALEASKAEFE